jgi:hypothetical protein
LGASDERVATIQQFVNEQGITFPVLRDQSRQLYYSYLLSGGISPYPRDFIIDQNGIFRYTNVEYDIKSMTLVIESLLDNTTGIDREKTQSPATISLLQNYPNPFNPQTTIEFETAQTSFVELSIYNLKGEKIRTLLKSNINAGVHSVNWTGMNDHFQFVPSGVYFYKIKSAGFTETRKMTLVR